MAPLFPEHLTVLERLAAQTSVALKNAGLVTELKDMFLGTITTLSSAIDAKSPWTAGHSKRVTRYALDIGKEMGLPAKDLKDLEMAGLLHDIGKLGTYQSILDKSYKLTERETKVLRLHPAKGAEILSPIKQMREIIPAIRHHHEFYNGEGYPDGLKGEEIPLMARILGVADSVDAMSAARPYRKGKPMNVIIAELKRCSGTQFDPKGGGCFCKDGGGWQIIVPCEIALLQRYLSHFCWSHCCPLLALIAYNDWVNRCLVYSTKIEELKNQGG